jgi:monoamine oxidase
MAGLNCAYQLKRSGISATLYEATNRLGGRIKTGQDLVAPGLPPEFGGEFINSNHAEVLRLAHELGVGVIDREQLRERDAPETVYFFEGRHPTEDEMIREVRPLIPRITQDRAKAGTPIDFRHPERAAFLDRLSMTEYLDQIGARGWIRRLVEVIYTAEFGLEPEEQSALNLITLITTSAPDRVDLWGDSDERYLIRGGSERLTEALARQLEGQIALHHRLLEVKERGNGFRLTFQAADKTVEVDADLAVLSIPFSVLRQVDLRIPLPAHKKRAILELGYGTNAKLIAGLAGRIPKGPGRGGEFFSDRPFQEAWTSSLESPAKESALTFFLGGRGGMELGHETPEKQRERLMEGFESGWPGSGAAFNGNVVRAHWPSDPFARGSYACYKPGQWTTIAGLEAVPVGNLLFAGEHCDREFQGYINGAARSGRQAAESILARV